MNEDREGAVSRLYGLALAALEAGDTEEAQRLAAELAELRNTGAFEIAARAHWLAGESEKAISLLRQGLESFPQVAVLWSWLGHFLSDSGRYDEAVEAFLMSSQGHGADVGMARYNMAISLWRKGELSEARAELEAIQGNSPPPYRVKEMMAVLAVDSGNGKEALELLESLAMERPKTVEADDLALMVGLFAEAYLLLGQTDEATRLARECLKLDRTQPRAARVLRLIEPVYADSAKIFKVTASSGDEEDKGQYTYYVVAGDEAEIPELLQRFERTAGAPRIQSVEEVEPAPEEPVGVKVVLAN
jgi:tetratricopeptide (TPR) repeat protein